MMVSLQLLGIIVLGIFMGLVVTPLIFYLTKIVAFLLALTVVLIRATLTSKKAFKVFPKFLKELPKYTREPIYESNNGKACIHYPYPIHDSRKRMEHRGIIGIDRFQVAYIANARSKADYRPSNKNTFDMVNQPTIKKVSNIIPNIFHKIILFYRRFYRCSTTVEQNLEAHMVVHYGSSSAGEYVNTVNTTEHQSWISRSNDLTWHLCSSAT